MDKYNRLNWENSTSTATPLSAENLNHMDEGIEAATTAITKLETSVTKKANAADVEFALANKADKATTLAGYGITDAIKNGSGTVSSTNLASSSVTSTKILNGAVTKTKLSADLQNEIDGKANTADVEAALVLKANSADVTKGLKEKQNVQYSGITITNIGDFIALNQTDTVYTGRMKGFSTKFGEKSDDAVKGFRMWFVLAGPINPEWYRIVVFDDGTIWRAERTSSNFTQVAYSKSQVNKLIAEKAGLDAYENAIELSTVSSSEQLNSYTDTNKTYVFNTVPPLASELSITTGSELCVLNNYHYYNSNDYIQIIRTTRYTNKVFSRTYNSTTDIWSKFTDITIPEGLIEQGVAPITITGYTKDDFYALNCRYQTVGDYCYITFTANPKVAIDSPLIFSGLPFVAYNTSILAAYTGKNNPIKIEITNDTSNLTITKMDGGAFTAGETNTFTIGHRIKS